MDPLYNRGQTDPLSVGYTRPDPYKRPPGDLTPSTAATEGPPNKFWLNDFCLQLNDACRHLICLNSAQRFVVVSKSSGTVCDKDMPAPGIPWKHHQGL